MNNKTTFPESSLPLAERHLYTPTRDRFIPLPVPPKNPYTLIAIGLLSDSDLA